MILYHSPRTRSSSTIALLHELGLFDAVEIRVVTVRRGDGSGHADPANAHPEGKVPYLVDGDEHIRERGAIFTYLCEKVPQAGFAPQPGAPGRGAFLSWMAYYQGVMEPVMVATILGLETDGFASTFRGRDEITAELRRALDRGDYLLGDRYSAADLLVASPYLWLPDFVPDDGVIKAWLERCAARESLAQTAAYDSTLIADMI